MRASNIRSASWNAKDTMDCASGTCTETFLFFGFLCMLFSGFASCRMLFSSVAGIPWPLPTKKREITRCYDRAFHSCRAVTQLQTEVSFNLNVRFLIVFVFCHLMFWFWFFPVIFSQRFNVNHLLFNCAEMRKEVQTCWTRKLQTFYR